ncbi:MAG: putative 2-hydroxyglutaryl-CoA dehydratase [Streblomastix strix]|uniref:Putative 2-hydroxyglutaryl-CoA dehydratase n=1 Tax=Streblomastix strix TaxID=222440 RepID=A0A5J4VME8_9EUKA|nr:MAG: putative 2-hydroxyglutaryl-CoA dehydratase [Streblomastix strix]
MGSIPKKPYIVLIHQFSQEHAAGYAAGINSLDYDFRVCPEYSQQEMVDCGLRFVNNDCCYGSVLIVGSVILALQKREFDPNKLHFVWIHMGGSCSSRCLGHLIRRAVIQAGFSQVGVSELNYNYLVNPEMSIGQTMRVNYAFVIGDLLTRVFHRCHPYEKVW